MKKIILLTLISFSITSCSVLGLGGSNSGRGSSGSTDSTESNIPLAQSGGSELRDINFAYNSTTLDMESKAALRDNAQWLNDNSSVSVIVEGHCDERGTSEYNLFLGQRRAQIVKEYLITSGIDVSRVNTQSYGEELPLVANSDEEAWAKNRRVHFKIDN